MLCICAINDFTDAALWPLLFLTAYEVTAQNCISEVHLFRILKITKIVCLGYSFVLVIEHILGIIPGTSEMFPTYVLLALVPFSLYETELGEEPIITSEIIDNFSPSHSPSFLNSGKRNSGINF
mgnify:CR=1 FL=1